MQDDKNAIPVPVPGKVPVPVAVLVAVPVPVPVPMNFHDFGAHPDPILGPLWPLEAILGPT